MAKPEVVTKSAVGYFVKSIDAQPLFRTLRWDPESSQRAYIENFRMDPLLTWAQMESEGYECVEVKVSWKEKKNVKGSRHR